MISSIREENTSPVSAGMSWISARAKGDIVIWFIVMMLSLISLLAVYSSTGTLAYKIQQGNTEYFIIKHFMLMMFGLVLMYGAHKVNYKYYSRIAQIGVYLSIPLLIVTYFFGSDINEAHRRLKLPVINLSFQTSDLAKLFLIMYVARMLSKRQEVIKDWKKATQPIIVMVCIVCGLIFPANLSTSAVLFITSMLLMFIGRANVKHLAIITGVIILFVAIAISALYGIQKASKHKIARVSTWVSRIDNFVSGDESEVSYQNQQANIAIASGGWFGKGPGNSVQKNFLPNPYADFIFAIIIEEYGMFGALVLMVLYLILLFRAIRVVIRAPKAFGALLAAGLTFSLVLQAFINMAVAVHLFPVTGLTLPLVSMGGTSLWFTSLAFGIILSVTRDIEEKENLETTPGLI